MYLATPKKPTKMIELNEGRSACRIVPFGLLDHQGIGLDNLVYLFGDISELKLSVSGTEINEMPNQSPSANKSRNFDNS